MSVRAILKNGSIQPLDPLPEDWADGQELVVEPTAVPDAAELQQWADDIEAAARAIPAEEHERFRLALEEVERESKDFVRREWGLK